MKRAPKLLVFIAIAVVLAAGIMGALSVVPHTHGQDATHAQHQNCPVYQLGLHVFASTLVPVAFLVPLFTAARFSGLRETRLVPVLVRSSVYLRAPPASL